MDQHPTCPVVPASFARFALSPLSRHPDHSPRSACVGNPCRPVAGLSRIILQSSTKNYTLTDNIWWNSIVAMENANIRRALHTRTHLSLSVIAEWWHVSPQTMRNWVDGRTEPPVPFDGWLEHAARTIEALDPKKQAGEQNGSE